jgi:hypothetical protein
VFICLCLRFEVGQKLRGVRRGGGMIILKALQKKHLNICRFSCSLRVFRLGLSGNATGGRSASSARS